MWTLATWELAGLRWPCDYSGIRGEGEAFLRSHYQTQTGSRIFNPRISGTGFHKILGFWDFSGQDKPEISIPGFNQKSPGSLSLWNWLISYILDGLFVGGRSLTNLYLFLLSLVSFGILSESLNWRVTPIYGAIVKKFNNGLFSQNFLGVPIHVGKSGKNFGAKSQC